MTRARDLAAGTFELATGGVLKLETSDTTVTDGSVLGKIEFKAPDEASGTDAILVGAAIEAVAEGTFAADNNATELVFKTGASAAADAKMTLTSGGNLGIGTSSPTADLHIVDDVATLSLESDNSNAQKWNLQSTYTNTGGSYGAFIIEDEAGSDWLRFDEGNGSPFSQFLVNGTEAMRIDSTGAVTMPLQPAFLVQPAAHQLNVGTSTTVTVVFGAERFDQNADFASNTFTAPVTGKYQLSYSLYLTNIDSAATYYEIYIQTSNRSYAFVIDPNFTSDLNYLPLTGSVLADMDASDTAYVSLRMQGGTAQTDISDLSYFSGYLAC